MASRTGALPAGFGKTRHNEVAPASTKSPLFEASLSPAITRCSPGTLKRVAPRYGLQALPAQSRLPRKRLGQAQQLVDFDGHGGHLLDPQDETHTNMQFCCSSAPPFARWIST